MVSYNLRRLRLLLYIVIFVLVSCGPKSDYISSPNEFSKSYLPLLSENLTALKEGHSWKVMNNAVSLIKYDLHSNQVAAVSKQDKMIIKLNITTGNQDQNNIRNASDFRILGIDEDGQDLLGAISKTDPLNREEAPEYLQGIAVWDTNTGSQTYCISDPCEIADSTTYKSTDIGASIGLDGKVIVVFGEDSYWITNLPANDSSGITLVNNLDSDYWWHIGNIAIDPHNNRMAIVYQEGRIVFDKIQRSSSWPLNFTTMVEKGDKGQLQPVHVALFDRTGKWLAIVRGDQLSIWDVDGWIKKIVYREEVGAIHGMSFSPSSKFLFLATEDKIKIINLDENKLEAELRTPNITTLDISEDNRLLFWGDENGTVHLWGVPEAQ